MPRLVGAILESQSILGTVTAGTVITKGDVLDKSGNVLQAATSSSTIHTIVGVAAETIDTAASTILFVPIVPFAQLWEFDTTNNTATTQRYESAILGANAATLNNTDSDVTGPTAIFTIANVVGAAADKKVIGWFNRLGPTST